MTNRTAFSMVRLGPFLLAAMLLASACDKFGEPTNPFDQDDGTPPSDTLKVDPDMQSIAGLHARIFVPTCANSGCHDGTFEPDFRTIESTYNTLVYHPIIKNDPQGSYTYRVVPGDPDASQLMARLTYDIDGQSGIMPLIVDSGAEWNTLSDSFVLYVRNWIKDGAKDIFGQSPSLLDAPPTMLGVMGLSGGQPLERADGGQGALRVPQADTALTLYFSLSDDKTLPQNLGMNKVRYAKGPDLFEGQPEMDLELISVPVYGKGFQGQTVAFTHRVSIDPSQMALLGETIYFRIYVTDSQNPVTEIPTNAGAWYIKNYFSFTIIL
jgi:hypothetical protein